MLRGPKIPAWQAACINDLLAIDGLELALVIVPASHRSTERSLLGLLKGPGWLWRLFNKGWVERRSAASRPVDVSSRLSGVPIMEVKTDSPKPGVDVFSSADIAEIQGCELDVIVRFAFGILRGSILTAARHGVWSFHHGDEREYRGRPPGFWELWDRRPTVGAMVQVLTERLDGGKVIERGTFRVVPHSYLKTRDGLFFGATDLVGRACRILLAGGEPIPEPSATTAPVRRDPLNAIAFAFLLRQAAASLAHYARVFLRAPKWTIGVVDAPIHSLLDGRVEGSVRWLAEPARMRYLADPFPVDEQRALAEDFDYKSHRGRIVEVDLETSRVVPAAFDIEVHASYPFVFEVDGHTYCVPETAAAGEARLFSSDPVDGRWVSRETLLNDLPALDSTIFEWDSRWWLFCTDLRRGSNERLLVFYATAPTGPWVAHSLNPVKNDVTSSRPGGSPFVHQGALYRPAQNDSTSYGGSLTICRIDSLTPDSFAETIVAEISPDPVWKHRAGFHTAAAMGERMLIDARRDVFLWPELIHQIRARLRRLNP